MKNYHTSKNQTTRNTLFTAYVVALAVAFTVSLPQPTLAGKITPPPVPANLQVPAGNKAFLKGHAVGTQQYFCLPCPNASTPAAMCPVSGLTWVQFGPQATLFKDNGKQILTHFLSPNPEENGTPRATWQDSKETSAVWAFATPATTSTDPAFVAPGAIPWLRLEVVGVQDGPTGGDNLTATTFIQRLNTSGGLAPSTGCTVSIDVGKKALVPYTADYFFYEPAENDADD